MTKKRFYLDVSEAYSGILKIIDFGDGTENIYPTSSRPNMEIVVELLNELNNENEQLKKLLECSRKEANDHCEKLMSKDEFIRLYKSQRDDALEDIKQLKEHIKSLEKQCHLIHMQSMFSTVKSFKGDVSKRYKYSEERDTIYDTANNYGDYDQVLDKKEVVMLLNEYETILKEMKK